MSCDLYNFPDTVSTNTESIDHSYDGFKNVGHTGTSVESVKMWLYKTSPDEPKDIIINLYHYEGTVLTNTYAPSGNIKYTDLTTSSSGQLVTWNLTNFPTLTANTVFAIADSVSGSGKARALSFTPVDFNDFSTIKNIPAVTVGWSFCGCITSGTAPPASTTTFYPPPPAYITL